MPSDTVMVLNSTPLPPAAFAPASASFASSLMCMLQGVRFAQVEAIPICGFLKSASLKPTARNIARDGVCFGPSTTRRDQRRGSFLVSVARGFEDRLRVMTASKIKSGVNWISGSAESLGEVTIHQTQHLRISTDRSAGPLARIPTVQIEMHPGSARLDEPT